MISVQNHLRRLNGNNWLWALSFFVISCSATKPVFHNPNTQIVKPSMPEPKTKKDTIILPENPTDQGKIGQSPDRKIDTIKWKDISDTNPPIKIVDKYQGQNGTKSGKNSYNIKLLIPLNSDKISDPGTSRFTYFYAGVLLALDKLDQEGFKVNLEVVDTEGDGYNADDTFKRMAQAKPDMIIGPFERDDVKKLTDICKERKIPVISPWYTSSKLTTENPYYIQMTPNLKEHFLRLVKYAVNTYRPGEVTILMRGSKDKPWIDYFEDEAKKMTGKNEFFNTYTVNTDSLRLGPTAYFTMFKKNSPKAVILPNYSYNDENYIYSSLRRLSAEIGTKSVSVIGMPILYESDKIEFDYYRALQMKVVMADYVDEDYGRIREFRRQFLDTYGEIPTVEAVKGHDLLLYLVKNLNRNGDNFNSYSNFDTGTYQANYEIQKSVSDDADLSRSPGNFDYYENKHLDIIEFRGNKWIRM